MQICKENKENNFWIKAIFKYYRNIFGSWKMMFHISRACVVPTDLPHFCLSPFVFSVFQHCFRLRLNAYLLLIYLSTARQTGGSLFFLFASCGINLFIGYVWWACRTIVCDSWWRHSWCFRCSIYKFLVVLTYSNSTCCGVMLMKFDILLIRKLSMFLIKQRWKSRGLFKRYRIFCVIVIVCCFYLF